MLVGLASQTRKSIISHFALSMSGDPVVLEGSFTDTDNAMERIRAWGKHEKRNVTIESLDYMELIKKYNGKPYKDLNEAEHPWQ